MVICTLKKTILRGDTNRIPFIARDQRGDVIDITGADMWFTAKTSFADTDAEAVISKTETNGITVIDGVNGSGEVVLQPSDTSSLGPFVHFLVYDIQVKPVSTGDVRTTQSGPLVVVPDAQRSFNSGEQDL